MSNESHLGRIQVALAESASVKQELIQQAEHIEAVAQRLAETFRAGGRLYACGNGGSACDAMHLVEELVARYRKDRPGLPAHHLMDAATLTCWSNDYEYATAFRRQVEAFVGPKDVLVAISTSGNSPNVLLAAETARKQGAWVLGLTGRSGGRLAEFCSELVNVPSDVTARIQEGHITLIHLWCDLLDEILFPDHGPHESH